jgi:hypothetical protein
MNLKTYLLAWGLMLLCTFSVHSQSTIIFTGGGNDGGLWSNPANWNLIRVPATNDNVFIGGGSVVTINDPLTFDFNIESYGDITVNTLVVNEKSILSGGSLTFSPSAGFINHGNFQNFNQAVFNGMAFFTNDFGATFINSGTFTLQTLLDNHGDLTNNGTLDALAGTLTTQGSFQNNQVLQTKSLRVLPGSTFTNAFGSHLTVTGTGMGILVEGTLNNFGDILNNGDLSIQNMLVNVGSLVSSGDVTVAPDATLNNNGGTVNNEGNFSNQGTVSNIHLVTNKGSFDNYGQFTNNSQVDNQAGGTFTNHPGGVFDQGIGAQLLNGGDFLNESTFNNSGLLQNDGTFINDGSIDNKSGSVLDNNGDFSNGGSIEAVDVFRNDGAFNNGGSINVKNGAVLSNFANFNNNFVGIINIRYEAYNKPGALFVNDGLVTNEIRFFNEGTFNNHASFSNTGDLFLKPASSITNAGQIFLESGNIRVEGLLVNDGELYDDECSTISNKGGAMENNGYLELKGILIQNGTYTGNPATVEGGYLHTSPDTDAPALCKNGTFGADVNGNVKVYANELIAFPNFDNCNSMVYRANGEHRPVFQCSDIGSVLHVNVVLRNRLDDLLTCVADVTPRDFLEPQFTTLCPSDINITTTAASVPVTWTPPVAVDNCTTTNLTSTHNPGDLFSAGNTSIIYTATDGYGNQNFCGFNVIVNGLTTCTTNSSPADNAVNIDFNAVTLNWAAAANALIYDVFVGTTNPPTTLVAPGVPGTSLTINNLAGNQLYYWYVVPKNLHGDAQGCQSSVTRFTTAVPCDNVTSPGSIGPDQELCNFNTAPLINSTAAASGGSNILIYVWQKTTLDPGSNPTSWTVVQGAASETYNPGTLAQTTWFRRGARRNGCEEYRFTGAVKVGLITVPQPTFVVKQPDCTMPLTGSISITNLPQNGYSRLDNGTAQPGKTAYTDLAPGQHTIAIGQGSCEVSAVFQVNSFYKPPVAVCKAIITRQLGASGTVAISPADIDNGSTSVCGPLTKTINGQASLTFDCSKKGDNPVSLMVTDPFGKNSSCVATVKIEDILKPTVFCKSNISVQLNSNGQASIVPADVFESGSDNCGGSSGVSLVAVQPDQFTCADMGAGKKVTLTVKDASGNPATCEAVVSVEDKIKPEIACKTIIVQLGENGKASILPSAVYAGGKDNCGGSAGVVLTEVVPNQFTCQHIGPGNLVILAGKDASGNLGSCQVMVAVVDKIAPVINCKSITVQLNDAGQASIVPADVYAGGTDNCGGSASVSLQTVTPNQFSCVNIGAANKVKLTAKDANGNNSECEATVTVEDKRLPVISCKDISIKLDNEGKANITGPDVYNGGKDNCGEVTLVSVSRTSFSCLNLGSNTVILTASDKQGNKSTCEAKVTVGVDDNLTSAYIILAKEEVHTHENVINGNVGVWLTDREAKIHENSKVNGFIKAPRFDITGGSIVAGQIAAIAPEPQPATFKYNTQPDPATDTKVPDNYAGVYLLQGKNFKRIEIGKNATARFTATGEIFIKELITKDGDDDKQTKILFSGNTELIIRRKLELGKRTAVNSDDKGAVKMYVEEDDVLIKESSKINASIDTRFKILKLEKGKAGNPTELTGQFIAKKVDADNFVQWTWRPYGCGLSAPISPLAVYSDHLGLAANPSTKGVELQWLTNTEYKNREFVIERSADGVHFEPLFEVQAKGRGVDVTSYRELDARPLEGTNYYRVKVIFEDGTSLLSESIIVNFWLNSQALTLFPNPVRHEVSMFWEGYAGKRGTVRILNSLGQPVIERSYDVLPADPVQVELGNLPDGMYWFWLKVDGVRERQARFMVAKED